MTVVTEYPRRMLDVAQVAAQLGVHKHTVYRLVDRGELSASRVGSRMRIDPRDVSALLERNRVNG